MISIKTLPFHLLLPVWLLISFSHGASSCHYLQSTVKSQELRRNVLEAEQNGTLVLAAERTHRRDPLNHFKYYTGGWNITDKHYLSSVAFSAAPLIGIAVAWFVLLGLFLFCACICCCCCRSISYGYSRTCYAFSLIFLVLFTIGVIAGCAILYTGQGKFYSSVEDTTTYLAGQVQSVVDTFLGLWNDIQAAKNLQIEGKYLLPHDIRETIDKINSSIHGSAWSSPDKVSDQAIHLITNITNPVRLVLIVIAAVMLGLAFLGFFFSMFGLYVFIYIFVILGWILITATILLSAVFLVFHNIVTDTYVAMDQWVQNPAADSALSQLLPCMDPSTVNKTLNVTKHATFMAVNMANLYISNVSNHEYPPDAPQSLFYFNQSGPPAPLLCNPLEMDLSHRTCAPGEVSLGNASEAYKKYVCQISGSGICITTGRLTPQLYEGVVGAAKVGYTLDHYGPFLGSLVDCGFVHDIFNNVSRNQLPDLSCSSRWVYAGLAAVSFSVMFSLIFWLVYERERRHRRYTKSFG